MKKQIIFGAVILVVIVGGIYAYRPMKMKPGQPVVVPVTAPLPTDAHAFSGQYNDSGYGKQDSSGNGVSIYADSATSILFHLDLYQRGNLGSLYGRATQTAPGIFTYYSKDNQLNTVCNFTMKIQQNELSIQSVGSNDDCGFGYGVTENGTYTKTNDPAPQYFVNGEGDKVYFSATPPEK